MSRKRKLKDTDSSGESEESEYEEPEFDESDSSSSESSLESDEESLPQIGSNFEIIRFSQRNKILKRLIAFPDEHKKICYEYYWNSRKMVFMCGGCGSKKNQKVVKAKFEKKNGENFINIEQKMHICQPRDYDPNKYIIDASKEVVVAPNFKLIEFEHKGISKRRLIVFGDSDRKKCYEYYWRNNEKSYTCCVCENKGRYVNAVICQNADGEDYVQLSKISHICEMRSYNPEKYSFDPLRQIIEAPNFELCSFQNNGGERLRLFIFLDTKRIQCYEYFWESKLKCYQCCGCNNKRIRVSAEICKKENGEEYVKLSSRKHVCDIRKYNPNKYDTTKNTVEAPNFEIISFIENSISKQRLFIFFNSDRKECYEFYWNKKGKYFKCCGCELQNKHIAAKIEKREGGTDYIRLLDTEHVCSPRDYDPQKYMNNKNIVEKPDFKIIKFEKNGIQKSILIIFCPSNKELCYEYFWDRSRNQYVCCECANIKHVTANVLMNEKDEEYVELSKATHVCNLRPYNADKFKANTIIEKSEFEVIETIVKGKLVKRLFLFTNADKQFCYTFYCDNTSKKYFCSQCALKSHHIRGSLGKDQTGNEYFETGNRAHICEPLKYLPRKIVKLPDYQLLNRKFGQKIVQKLILFDSNDKDLCYEYVLERNSLYRCLNCKNYHKTAVTAKLIKNEKYGEFIQLCQNEHKCKPIKFIPEYEIKILLKPDFKLDEYVTKNGVNIKLLSIFDQGDKSKCYTYNYTPGAKEYRCNACRRKNQSYKKIYVKLLHDKNGEDYVEFVNDHICQSQTYHPPDHTI
uniref:Transposase n=1 Tax=Panagrolaimus sp. ES5 TaxID=591445 RepID=A0AC34FAT2_9BILA